MQTTAVLFEQWQAHPDEIKSVTLSQGNDDLVNKLKALGLETDSDPFQVFSQNREKLQKAFQIIQKAGVCWCLRQKGIDPAPWEKNAEQMIQSLIPYLEKTGFTSSLDDNHIFSLLKLLPRARSHAIFWQHIDDSSDINVFLDSLGISAQDLESAQAKLDEYKEELRRKRRLVNICGGEFDSSEDNLPSLWSFICGQMPDENLGGLAPIDLLDYAELEKVAIRSKKKREVDGQKPKHKKPSRVSKSMENLIGLAGEIHAFRMLRRVYGTSKVTQSQWISNNSLYVFPDKSSADDNYGCDFEIFYDKTTYCIEVKASQGDDDTFSLGSSETTLAMELSKHSGKRKKIFQILHITDALSDNPVFRLLPNPYDKKYESFYSIEDADTRIRYKHG